MMGIAKKGELPMSTQSILTALGPLAPLFEDPAVTEIMVDAADRVTYEKNGIIEDGAIRFDPPETLRTLIDNVMALTGTTLAPGETVQDFRFPDNRTRALVVLPPTALSGPYLVIRKSPFSDVTWDLLYQFGAMNQEIHDLLQAAILARANIMVAGGTASGKTTILNRLAELIPPNERVVIAESSHEFQIKHPRAVYLEAHATGMPMKDLLEASTKMRPDRLVISELRGSEALHVLEIFNNGHDGGMTTIHSMGIEDTLTRLETMCLMANLGLGLSEIRSMIASAFQLILYQKRLPNGKRRITEIVELRGIQDERYILQPLMRYNPENDVMELTSVKPSWA
jgi:pilus assembly protein CpaF